MNAIFYLLAQRGADSPVNKWLGEHPVVLGIIFLVIGGALALSGVYELWQGVARDKDGTEIRGFTGQVIAVDGGLSLG